MSQVLIFLDYNKDIPCPLSRGWGYTLIGFFCFCVSFPSTALSQFKLECLDVYLCFYVILCLVCNLEKIETTWCSQK